MAVLALLFVLVQSLIQYPQPAGDGLDEATHRRMQERQELLEREMARLLQELEQGQQDEGWGALLFGALQQWPFWALAGVLLLLGLWLSHRRRSCEVNTSGKDQVSCITMEEGKQWEDDSVDLLEDGGSDDTTVEAEENSTGNDRDGSPVAAMEGDEDDANEDDDETVKEDHDIKNEDGHNAKDNEGRSDGNVPGDNTAGGPGNIAGKTEGHDEENEGENMDVKVEQDRDAGNNEGNAERTNYAKMKAGNNDDLNEGQDNVNGMENNMDMKVQESSDASQNRSRDWTGQEDSSDGGNAVEHCGFAATEEKKDDSGNEEDNDGNIEEKHTAENVKGQKYNDGKEREGGKVAATEKEGSDCGKEEGGSDRCEKKEDIPKVGNKRGILLVDRIQVPVEELERGCSVTAELMESFTRVFADSVSNSFYPVPQGAIGVGSAFEGWSPSERDVVYRVLVPLNPPLGHTFHLEQNGAGHMAARTFRIHVELVCTCKREQQGEKLLCFLHHSEEELRQQQKLSLLETLCTSSYLDVEKTSHWFYELVRSSWLQLPEYYSWHLVFQPCSRSCQFRLSKGKKNHTVEILFGVRQGDSDIFVVSQPPEAQKGGSSISVSSSRTSKANCIPSTVWLESSAVAEVKFFQHIARQVPCESLHLKCLQVFTCILKGTGFSSSTWKTVVMHVLTTVPLPRWHRREFARRLWDIMAYLRRCLQVKRLEHFFLGNERFPAEISVPLAMKTVEPLNLFEHLARDPAAHAQAMRAYGQLRLRLWMLLSSH